MKNKILLLLLISLPLTAFANEKDKFDLPEMAQEDPVGLSKTSVFYQKRSQNNWLDVTLVTGGYFTIGTTGGLSAGNMDDHCQITYGHPYAMTSFPVFSIDGQWYRLADYFSPAEIYPQQNGDTLFVELTADKFALRFNVINERDSAGVQLHLTVTNLDSAPHDFGFGFVIDPALGKWGDGHIFFDGVFLENSVEFPRAEIPERLNIWEKSVGAAGLGMAFSTLSQRPDRVIAANWHDVHQENAPLYTPETRALYDLDLKFYWDEVEVAPNRKASCLLEISPLEPDFNRKAFLRWDMPGFLTLTENLLFPRALSTFFEISGTQEPITNATLGMEFPTGLKGSETYSPISVEANRSTIQPVNITSQIIYEDKVVAVTGQLKENGVILDEFSRNVFIPATPVSDTGLDIILDSLITDFPDISVTFEVMNEEKGFLISQLSDENIFLYENGNRVTDFTFGKDKSGGVDAADFVFVLDVTGSMSNEIDEVKNNIVEFSDSLSFRGVDFRLAMVTFLDEIENVYDFTDDVQYFQGLVASQHAHGGGDSPENSLDALYRATQLDFRHNAKRIFIWITDEAYHESNWATNLTKAEVIDALLTNEITVHSVGSQSRKQSYYDPIIIATGGNYYNINGNFRDILLDISRLKAQTKYLLSYTSSAQAGMPVEIKLNIRFAGLGGSITLNYTPGQTNQAEKHLSFFPNPFNPEIKFLVNGENYQQGAVEIYNILGQQVRKFQLQQLEQGKTIVWNATNDVGLPVGTGAYIVRLSLKNAAGKTHHETAKVLYIK